MPRASLMMGKRNVLYLSVARSAAVVAVYAVRTLAVVPVRIPVPRLAACVAGPGERFRLGRTVPPGQPRTRQIAARETACLRLVAVTLRRVRVLDTGEAAHRGARRTSRMRPWVAIGERCAVTGHRRGADWSADTSLAIVLPTALAVPAVGGILRCPTSTWGGMAAFCGAV